MAWLRIDDTVPEHRKMLRAGPSACWFWLCGIAYCQRQLTDGFIPDEAIEMIGVRGNGRARKLADVLVSVGLFEPAEHGYRVHDYHDHNATAEEALANRALLSTKRADAGRLGGIRSGIARREATKQNASNASKQNEAPTRPSTEQDPPTPHADARGAAPRRLTRALRKRVEAIRASNFGCRHDPRCATAEACVYLVADELRAQGRA